MDISASQLYRSFFRNYNLRKKCRITSLRNYFIIISSLNKKLLVSL